MSDSKAEKISETATNIMAVLRSAGLSMAEMVGLLDLTKLSLWQAFLEEKQCSTTDSSGQS